MAPDEQDPEAVLPPGLVDAVAGILLAPAGDADAALQALYLAHPTEADALRRLAADIRGADLMMATSFAPPGSELPDRIGRYRVLSLLGEGAFGTVYRCAEEELVQREVAVKLLRPGVGDRQTLRRFAAERQLLATLDHPTIARLFDAGAFDDGRPFFVMERIDGPSLTAYADLRTLDVAQRLRLFVEVCRGVQHAHDRGIVHRDLKPANILVAEHDGQPQPKIIDFGIAKMLAAPTGDEPLATATGRVVGTPGYMSPEQSRGASAEIDARADVFSLGVVLFELLVGERPWPEHDDSKERDPPRPSTRATDADRCGTPPERLVRQLRGDLDWIVLRALQPERERRYQSVQQFADDVERHLVGLPVEAGPPGVAYRLRKLVRRHGRALAWSAALVLVAAAGIAASSHFRSAAADSEAQRVEQARTAADQLLARATDPRMEDAADEAVQELLHVALQLCEQTLADHSDRVDLRQQRLRTLGSLASTHFLLGQYRQGRDLASAARDEAEQLLALTPNDELRLLHALAQREIGRCSFLLRDIEMARTASGTAVDELLQLQRRQALQHDKSLAKAMVEYASALGRSDDAAGQLDTQQRAIAVLQQYTAARPDDAEAERDLIRFHCGLANILLRREDTAGAETTLRRADELASAAPGATDEERALVCFRQGKLFAALGRAKDAIAVCDRAVEFTVRLLLRHPGRRQLQSNLLELRAMLCAQHCGLGDGAAAAAQGEQAIAENAAVAGVGGRQVAATMLRMSRAIADADDVAAFAAGVALAARSAELFAGSGDEPEAAASRIEAQILRGHLLGELGQPCSAGAWQELVAAAVREATKFAASARLQLADRLLAAGDLGAAREALAAARQDAGRIPPAWDLARCGAAIELAAGDAVAAVAVVDALLAADRHWQALHVAATVLVAAGERLPAAAAAPVRARAAKVCEELLQATAVDAAESATVRRAVRAQAGLRLSLLLDDPERARALRAEHLPGLLRSVGHVGASWWDEPLWQRVRR